MRRSESIPSSTCPAGVSPAGLPRATKERNQADSDAAVDVNVQSHQEAGNVRLINRRAVGNRGKKTGQEGPVTVSSIVWGS
jgi:hypothetical protein